MQAATGNRNPNVGIPLHDFTHALIGAMGIDASHSTSPLKGVLDASETACRVNTTILAQVDKTLKHRLIAYCYRPRWAAFCEGTDQPAFGTGVRFRFRRSYADFGRAEHAYEQRFWPLSHV